MPSLSTYQRPSFSSALYQMERERRHDGVVREVRLRATSGAAHLTSWRGRSGKSYIATIHTPDTATGADLCGSVIVAVGRDGDGVARVVGVAAAGHSGRALRLDGVIGQGATESHVIREAQTGDDRALIVADLTDR